MRTLVESLKRLYNNLKIDELVVQDLYENGRISKKERDYILGKMEG